MNQQSSIDIFKFKVDIYKFVHSYCFECLLILIILEISMKKMLESFNFMWTKFIFHVSKVKFGSLRIDVFTGLRLLLMTTWERSGQLQKFGVWSSSFPWRHRLSEGWRATTLLLDPLTVTFNCTPIENISKFTTRFVQFPIDKVFIFKLNIYKWTTKKYINFIIIMKKYLDEITKKFNCMK